MHIRLEVTAKQVQVYLNKDPEPVLSVKKLNDRTSGRIGFWVGYNSGGRFANLQISE